MISVVIPLYNASEYICGAFDSALSQDVNMEIIVVDDGSEDASLKVLCDHVRALPDSEEKILGEDKAFLTACDEKNISPIYRGNIGDVKILIVKNNVNSGAAHTRNIGVLLARGEYVAFLDADDTWDKSKLKKQLKLIERTNAPLVSTSRKIAEADGKSTGRIIYSPKIIDLKTLKKSNYVNCSSVLAKREVLLDIPMEHSEAHEDYLAWLRICKKYGSIYCLDEPLMTYRLSKNSKSGSKLKSALMTYKTYVLFCESRVKAFFMMFSYAICGIKKYFKNF